MTSTTSAEAVTASLVDIWGRQLKRTDVPLDVNFFELGGQSSTFVRVAMEIEQRYGIEMSLRDFFDAPTVTGLTGVVAAALAAKESSA